MTKEVILCPSCKGRGKKPIIRANEQPRTCEGCEGSGRLQIITTVVTKPYPAKK
ncbi:hypothetical protein KAR91_51395 [Candidatus Pacearchaeota archaeon]|nr:hypothetical protein [Candidatus Pacearchaeota archaeon]